MEVGEGGSKGGREGEIVMLSNPVLHYSLRGKLCVCVHVRHVLQRKETNRLCVCVCIKRFIIRNGLYAYGR